MHRERDGNECVAELGIIFLFVNCEQKMRFAGAVSIPCKSLSGRFWPGLFRFWHDPGSLTTCLGEVLMF